MLYAKPNINISFIGQTYTGKSTLISNLINNLGDSDTINELDPLYKSLDNTQYRYKPVKTRYLSLFQINTEKTSFTLIDTPGESCYFRCLVTGIILTDVAILVTPSSKGELDLTHPRFGLTMYHSFFATELGTKQSIICVNKISENANTLTRSEFEEMRITILMLLTKARLTTENFIFIPISTCKKQNILEPCAEFSWYNGPTLLEVIKNLEHPKSNTEKPLRIIVYDSFQKLCNSLVVAGLIISGSLSVGQSVVFAPSGIIAEVQSIEILKKRIEVAWEGNIIGFFVRNVGYKDVKKGFVVSDLKNEPAKECEFFSAEIYILENPCKIKVGY